MKIQAALTLIGQQQGGRGGATRGQGAAADSGEGGRGGGRERGREGRRPQVSSVVNKGGGGLQRARANG